MLNTKFFPLRTTVGKAIRVANVMVVNRSHGLERTKMQEETVEVCSNINEVVNYDYSAFLPDWILTRGNDQRYNPFEGVSNRLPTPSSKDLPFYRTDEVIHLKGLLPRMGRAFDKGPNISSRDLWIEIRIEFKSQELIGGICYAGHRFLPYYITPQGENSANFGLPKEWRLGWKSSEHDGFLDDESTISVQEPISHNGVHFLCTGPVKTDNLILRLSDFPRFLKSAQSEERMPSGLELVEQFGFLIPFLYVFEYSEGTRYRPHVPMGLLCAIKSPQLFDHTYFASALHFLFSENPGDSLTPSSPGRDDRFVNICADFIYPTKLPKNQYFPLSGGSIIGQGRTYQVDAVAGSPGMEEVFCSAPLKKGDTLIFYLEQGEENLRTVAGLRLTFSFLTLEGILKLPSQKIKIFEIDLPEGASPIDVAMAIEDNKYANCIFEVNI